MGKNIFWPSEPQFESQDNVWSYGVSRIVIRDISSNVDAFLENFPSIFNGNYWGEFMASNGELERGQALGWV